MDVLNINLQYVLIYLQATISFELFQIKSVIVKFKKCDS